MDLYAQNILDRYKEPYYRSKPVRGDACESQKNPSCGDRIEVSLEIEDGIIKGYSFDGEGCAISQAAADILGDLILDRPASEIADLPKAELFEALGIEISLRRDRCATLALESVKRALKTAGSTTR